MRTMWLVSVMLMGMVVSCSSFAFLAGAVGRSPISMSRFGPSAGRAHDRRSISSSNVDGCSRVVLGAGNASGGGGGKIERIEFHISASGLVTEHVVGVTGPNCKVVTEEINKLLGEVVATENTSEMFEVQTYENSSVYNSASGDDSSGAASQW